MASASPRPANSITLRKIYEYRSQLAHGGNPDFGGKLQVLGDDGRVQELVMETVKAIIRQTLIEPRLLLDLREC